jgi:hypothetical protein
VLSARSHAPRACVQVWERVNGWKVPAYTEICATYQNTKMTPAEKQAANLPNFAGYFEARLCRASHRSCLCPPKPPASALLSFPLVSSAGPSPQRRPPALAAHGADVRLQRCSSHCSGAPRRFGSLAIKLSVCARVCRRVLRSS